MTEPPDWDPFTDSPPVDPDTGEVGPDAAEPAPALKFARLDLFVEEYLVLIYRRDLDMPSLRWCPEWFKHAEAIARLEAMWRAWELLRLDPGEGASNWWLAHCDPHMRVLLSESGPFRNCKNGKHAEARSLPLPVVHPPKGVFEINA
ncbi:MAG: DUF4913 domain-containing protein [Salinibacterium sp.]|nr:MAG: DUF4913 domain-containing protein [Salinibacterium sp.]